MTVVLDLGVDTSTVTDEAMAGVVSVFAQMERRRIGERTREALDAARNRGVQLGRPRELDETTRTRILALRGNGLSFAKIAQALEAERVPTARGGARWHPEVVRGIVASG